jgi:hypothetical protein
MTIIIIIRCMDFIMVVLFSQHSFSFCSYDDFCDPSLSPTRLIIVFNDHAIKIIRVENNKSLVTKAFPFARKVPETIANLMIAE